MDSLLSHDEVKTMKTKFVEWIRQFAEFRRLKNCSNSGQTLVEFTLIFLLLLVIAWIPADFGLAFYTSHQPHNASREGARIAAADPSASTQVGTCALSTCYSYAATHPLYRAATRVSSALMPDTQVTLAMVNGGTCNQQVQVTVSGTYNYFFYRLLGWFGVTTGPSTVTRQTMMRWEHQC